MDKQIKYVVAVVLLNKNGEYLAVKRPDDDPDLGGAWGLPAVTFSEGELPETAALRVCEEN